MYVLEQVGILFKSVSVLVFSLLFLLLPFVLNYKLAQSRGKSVPLMLILTIVFSWIVTLILAFLPRVDKEWSIKFLKRIMTRQKPDKTTIKIHATIAGIAIIIWFAMEYFFDPFYDIGPDVLYGSAGYYITGLLGLILANIKNRNPLTWFALGLWFAIFPIIVLIFLPKLHDKLCPKCREGIALDASICPHCRSEIHEDRIAESSASVKAWRSLRELNNPANGKDLRFLCLQFHNLAPDHLDWPQIANHGKTLPPHLWKQKNSTQPILSPFVIFASYLTKKGLSQIA